MQRRKSLHCGEKDQGFHQRTGSQVNAVTHGRLRFLDFIVWGTRREGMELEHGAWVWSAHEVTNCGRKLAFSVHRQPLIRQVRPLP